jgi:serine/threonine protein kinase/DNA polymerase III delta prime subunit
MKFCRHCGAKLSRPDAQFCPKCGHNLTAEKPVVTISPLALSPIGRLPSLNTHASQQSSQELPQEPQPVTAASLSAPLAEPQETFISQQDVSGTDASLVKGYRLLNSIGDGHMSEVYRAEDIEHHNRVVAVKLLNTRHKDDVKQAMYLRETKALEKLEHPNIVKQLAYGWSEERRCHYIVLEYLPGTLEEEIGRHPDPRDQEWCWPVMRDITDALMHAHSKEVIHRDVKTTNILLSATKEPKLTDFGISLLRSEVRTGATLSGFWSEGFAAPEQRAGKDTTEESDIYSLGCVFYHMLARKAPPSEGPSPQDIQALNLRPLLADMLVRMLDPDPKERFGTEQLARFLEQTWKYQTYPDLYFVVTKNVGDILLNQGFTASISQEAACAYLQHQFMQEEADGFPCEVQIKLEQSGLWTVFTDTMRLTCTREEKSPVLLVTSIDPHVYPPSHEDQRKRVPYVRRRWHFISNSRNYPAGKRDQLQVELDGLYGDLLRQKEEEQKRRKQRWERKDFTELWGKVLDLQQRLFERTRLLEYEYWEREGSTITFYLKEPALDDLGWQDDAPIAFQRSGTSMESIGLYMGASGSTVEVSLSQVGSFEPGTSRRTPPRTGRIGLFQIENISSHSRQKRALEMLISGGTVNHRLPDVLQDLSLAEFAPLDEDIPFSQTLGEDQKSAVRQALATQDIFLLQGPPGTGKTTTLAEIILHILQEKPDARILVSSQSNVAVNHVLAQVVKGNKSIGILRIGRPERIGPGAEAWTREKQLSVWREEVLSRTKVVITDLETRMQAQHTRHQTFYGRINPARAEQLEKNKVWLEELTGKISDLMDIERKMARLQDRLQPEKPLSEKMARDLQRELAEAQKQASLQREYISGTLELVRNEVPEYVPLDPLSADFAEERANLYQIITDLLSPDPEASLEEKLLAVVRNWQSVFGIHDDFDDLLYERANILAATCLMTGIRTLREMEFDWAIIDEGGRATATELLIPLIRARRSIIVGDERQLPPMVDSDLREEVMRNLDLKPEDLEKSLFETLVDQGREEELPAVQMLKQQYRMHPAIGELVSQVFYEGKLQHATPPAQRQHKLRWLETPVVWYSTTKLDNHAENPRGTSFSNSAEVEVIVWLLRRMEQSYLEMDEKRNMAIITPYNEQIRLLREAIYPADRTFIWVALNIEIASVDAFQGRDSHLVIYSAVRSNKPREIGFLKDRRRLNVALSRAQQLLIIVGDMAVLSDARLRRGEKNPYIDIIEYMRTHEEECSIERLEQGDLHEQ